ncbi:hypothetical protein J4422_00665 [Candidatus Pacearchaeota archaeon]|nr:hypothetical protein [Candidatus Pacearchaeota archaeon]
MQERENILRIFRETKGAVLRDDVAKIKNLSDQTTNTASLTHDPDNIAAAVIIYSLSKILQREDYKTLPGWENFYKVYMGAIDKSIDALERRNDEGFRQSITQIREAIGKLSGKLKNYIQDVFRSAEINKASRIYEHGISMEKTARLLGVTLFELARYAGEKEDDIPESITVSVKDRVKFAMEMFEK